MHDRDLQVGLGAYRVLVDHRLRFLAELSGVVRYASFDRFCLP